MTKYVYISSYIELFYINCVFKSNFRNGESTTASKIALEVVVWYINEVK